MLERIWSLPKFCCILIIGVLRSVTRKRIHDDDFALYRLVILLPRFIKDSIGSQNTTARYRQEDLAAYSGVPQSFLSFPRLSHVPVPRQPRRSLLLLLLRVPLRVFSFFQSLLIFLLFTYFSHCFSWWVKRLKVLFTLQLNCR